jgi:hypothetical protein
MRSSYWPACPLAKKRGEKTGTVPFVIPGLFTGENGVFTVPKRINLKKDIQASYISLVWSERDE